MTKAAPHFGFQVVGLIQLVRLEKPVNVAGFEKSIQAQGAWTMRSINALYEKRCFATFGTNSPYK